MLQLFFFLFYKLPLAALSTFLDIYLRWALVVLYTRISLGSLGLKPELMGGVTSSLEAQHAQEAGIGSLPTKLLR